ncbi:ACT domain-containing protein [Pseudonocardia sp. C8]|uniref:aspartate racemase/maleate isomerase family protein n=1 Tax=Pseudonocardia sp. C8 TaxID=2762759 RepID=UPI0016426E8F|nr:ACT domain-containing protein [Pseudonocardia sp. C8]
MAEQLYPQDTVWGVSGHEPGSGVGVIVPYDFALDRELWRWVPDASSLHVTRTPFVASPVTADQARAISDPEPVRRATRDVLVPEPGVVAFACTSGSFVDGVTGERALVDVMHDAGAAHAITTAGALVAACTALGAQRISVVTPYVDDLTGKLEQFLAAHGIATVERIGLGLLGQIWRVSYSEVVRAVRAADDPDAQAVFISCTNLATYDVIAELEREVGKPVLTANQVTMWAALGAVGMQAVGPGQSLVACRVPEPDRPVLRAVPEPLPEPSAVDDPGGVDAAPTLYKVRVRLPDESGALARLTGAVAEAGGNILGLSVHGQDSRSVVDEMLVGGELSRARLTAVVRGVVRADDPEAVRVIAADPHELVDAPTRALDLVSQVRTQDAGADDSGALAQGLAVLLSADDVTVETEAPDPADEHALGLLSPCGNWLVARRGWAAFTVTERARADGFLRAATAQPRRAGYEVLLPDGEEVLATPATGDEVAELDTLLRTCLAGTPDDAAGLESWTAADLRAMLLPPFGVCLVVRIADGHLVAAGALLQADETDPEAGPEPVILVHPLYRGLHLARWLRGKLAATVTT